MKTITINGREFELYVPTKHIPNKDNLERYAGRSITDCYDRPSKTKSEIYYDWLQWAINSNVEMFGVSSYNSNIFTLQGYIEMDGKKYILSITKCHNIATLIPEV